MSFLIKSLSLLAILLLAESAAAQAPSTSRMGNTLWTQNGLAEVRLPVMGTQSTNYNPLYTNSTLNPQKTDDSVVIPFNCPAGCVTLMPRSTAAVFPPNHFTCFVNEGAGTLTVGSQDNVNSPIEGAPLSANTILLPQYGSLCLRAKPNNHYEMVGPSVLPGGNYTWTGNNKHLGPDSAPACPLAAGSAINVNLSTCASDATKGIVNNAVTLTQNATIALPTGTDGQIFGLRINHGTGPFTLTFGGGFSFGASSLSGGQPILCSAANCIDQLWCNLYNAASEADCSVALSNLTAIGGGPPPTLSIAANHTNGGGSVCTPSVTTCSVAASNTVTGHYGLIGVWWGTTTPAGIGDITSITEDHGNTCAYSSNSFAANPAGNRATAIFECPIISGAGTSNWTVHFASPQDFAGVYYAECVGCQSDSGLSNHANGTGTAISVSASGAVSGTSLAFFMMKDEGANSATAGSGWTLLDQRNGGSPDLDEYRIASSGTFSGTATGDVSGGWAASIAVFGPNTVTPVLSGITPTSANFSTPASGSTPLTTVSATCSVGFCSGATFSKGTGPGTCNSTDNALFNVASNGAITPVGTISTPATYHVGVVVTLAGASNSPQCYTETLIGSGAVITAINLSPGATFTIPRSNPIETMSVTCTGTCGTPTFALVTAGSSGGACTVSSGNSAFSVSGANLNAVTSPINDTTARTICLQATVP